MVVGVGGLGRLAVQFLELLTSTAVVAVDLDARKRRRARELGADRTASTLDAVRDAAAVLDFVGSDETLVEAAQAVGTRGIVVQVGEAGGRLPVGLGVLPYDAHYTASVYGPIDDLKAVLSLARRRRISWHVETMPLARANKAIGRLRAGDVLGRLVL